MTFGLYVNASYINLIYTTKFLYVYIFVREKSFEANQTILSYFLAYFVAVSEYLGKIIIII
jgi:hypothetical protein